MPLVKVINDIRNSLLSGMYSKSSRAEQDISKLCNSIQKCMQDSRKRLKQEFYTNS